MGPQSKRQIHSHRGEINITLLVTNGNILLSNPWVKEEITIKTTKHFELYTEKMQMKFVGDS